MLLLLLEPNGELFRRLERQALPVVLPICFRGLTWRLQKTKVTSFDVLMLVECEHGCIQRRLGFSQPLLEVIDVCDWKPSLSTLLIPTDQRGSATL